jgi:hypothetical protein
MKCCNIGDYIGDRIGDSVDLDEPKETFGSSRSTESPIRSYYYDIYIDTT